MSKAFAYAITMTMFNSGLLCKCDNWKHNIDDDGVKNSELVHNENCEGQEKTKKMLSIGGSND